MKKVTLFLALAVGLMVSATAMAQNVLLSENFDTVTLDINGVASLNFPTGWTTIDADNDRMNWYVSGSSTGFGGGNCATSASWTRMGALTPDNYLITPKVEGARRVEFFANAQDASSLGLGDHFAVCASSTGTSASDFTVIFEDTPSAAPAWTPIQKAPGTWRRYVVNLPEGTKYVAFRHYNCTDFFRINIDNVTVYDSIGTGGVVPQLNMNRFIKLNVVKDSAIKLDFRAVEAGTPIKIVSGSLDTTITVGTAWHGDSITYKAGDSIMTVYGNLIGFSCGKNGANVTAVDASKNENLTNLICSENRLTKLNVSGCEELTDLDCNSSNLTDIDIKSCVKLKRFDFHGNRLTTATLETLYCSLPDREAKDSAAIFPLKDASDTNVDTVAASTKTNAIDKNWRVLYSDSKTDIAATNGTHVCYPTNMSSYITIAVTKDSTIKLSLTGDATNPGVMIISGSVRKNIPIGEEEYNIGIVAGDSIMTLYGNIKGFGCGENGANVTAIDASHNTELATLSTFRDSISSLDISKNTKLTFLDCQYNRIGSLDVSKNTELQVLGCSGNKGLTVIDLSKNTQLTTLWCGDNDLSTLDVSSCRMLRSLRCSNNKLTSLDVSSNPNLQEIRCSDNQLTNIDVSHNSRLDLLDCADNQLTNLDISNNTNLSILFIFGNRLTTAIIDDLYCSLPDRRSAEGEGYLVALHESSPETEKSTVMATNARNAADKNWAVVIYQNDDNIALISTTGSHRCSNTGLAETVAEQTITLYPNPVADMLYLSETARTIRIYDVYGKEVANAADTDRIDVSNLPAGVYTVRADGTVAKIVKR